MLGRKGRRACGGCSLTPGRARRTVILVPYIAGLHSPQGAGGSRDSIGNAGWVFIRDIFLEVRLTVWFECRHVSPKLCKILMSTMLRLHLLIRCKRER